MSGQDRKQRIISDLKIIGSLQPNQTLSSSTMSIIDHGTWSSSLWRKYAGESRKDTINFIRNIFLDAIAIFEIDESHELILAIDEGVRGFTNLEETYRGDYLTIAEIHKIISDVRDKMNSLGDKMLNESIPNVGLDTTIEDCLHQMMMGEIVEVDESMDIIDSMALEPTDQKIPANTNTEERGWSIKSDTKEVVPTPNRGSYPETAKTSITSNINDNSPKDSHGVANIDIIHLVPEQSQGVVPEISQAITKRNSDTDFRSRFEESGDSSEEEYRYYEYVPSSIPDEEVDSSVDSESNSSPIRRSQSVNMEFKSCVSGIDDIDYFQNESSIIKKPEFRSINEYTDDIWVSGKHRSKNIKTRKGYLQSDSSNLAYEEFPFENYDDTKEWRNNSNMDSTKWIHVDPISKRRNSSLHETTPHIVRLAHIFMNWVDTVVTSDHDILPV
jgi:hypothetical protein